MPSWRDVLKIHPACELFPLMSPAELKELGEDIKKNGLQQRIQLWPVDEPPGHVLLDGRNRLDAMEAVGLKLVDNPNATTVEEIFAGDNIRATLIAPIPAKAIDPVAYVISANIRRRHLTWEQKRTLIAELLRADPNRSNLWTAKSRRPTPRAANSPFTNRRRHRCLGRRLTWKEDSRRPSSP